MSFLMTFLFEGKGVLAGDCMITYADGSHEVSPMVKFTKLSPQIICGESGNSSVWQPMEATLAGLSAGCGSLDQFEQRLKLFPNTFSPIYERIPKEELGMCLGGAQTMGLIQVGGEMGIFSVNHVPSQNDYEVTLCQKIGGTIVSNPDGVSAILRILQSLTFKSIVYGGSKMPDKLLIASIALIYRRLSKVDPTISGEGSLCLWRNGGELKEVEFGD